jgi:hypothetical protein
MFSCRQWQSARRASEARHGAAIARDAEVRKQRMTTENVTYWAKHLADGLVRERFNGVMVDYDPVPTLHESAFDWPIYRAAFGQ